MRKLAFGLGAAVFSFCGTLLHATIFGKIQGVVHNPQHRPVSGAAVKLQAATSDWSQPARTDDNGEVTNLRPVPLEISLLRVNSPMMVICTVQRARRRVS